MNKKQIFTTKPGNIYLNERMFSLRTISEPDAIQLNCVMESGEAEAYLTLFDGNGKPISLPPQRLSRKSKTIRWDIRSFFPP